MEEYVFLNEVRDAKTCQVIFTNPNPVAPAFNRPDSFLASPIITKDRIFVSGIFGYAIDRHTGQIIWQAPVYPANLLANINPRWINSSQLMLAGNKLIVEITFNVEGGPLNKFIDVGGFLSAINYQGHIVALNQDTGHMDWALNATNVNGIQYGGGSGGFGAAAYDPKRNTIYVGLGDQYDCPPGTNTLVEYMTCPVSPYTDALLAINSDTGAVQWSYQFYPNDIYSILAYPNTVYSLNGKIDKDVRGHPQLFTLDDDIDYVSVTGKDGTVRIWTRDQVEPSNHEPVVQVQLAPLAAGFGGSIPVNPAIYKGVMYLDTVFGVGAANTVDKNGVYTPPGLAGKLISADYLIVPGVPNSQWLYLQNEHHLLALDLKKLIRYGRNNPASMPVCYEPGGRPIIPALCSGQLPEDQKIVVWDKVLGTGAWGNTSGIAYANGVLFVPFTNNVATSDGNDGSLFVIDAKSGAVIKRLKVGPPNLVEKATDITPNLTLANYHNYGGVSILNGRVYASFLSFYNRIGGLIVYGLPDDDNKKDDNE